MSLLLLNEDVPKWNLHTFKQSLVIQQTSVLFATQEWRHEHHRIAKWMNKDWISLLLMHWIDHNRSSCVEKGMMRVQCACVNCSGNWVNYSNGKTMDLRKVLRRYGQDQFYTITIITLRFVWIHCSGFTVITVIYGLPMTSVFGLKLKEWVLFEPLHLFEYLSLHFLSFLHSCKHANSNWKWKGDRHENRNVTQHLIHPLGTRADLPILV